jgi:hypothetical protein
MNMVEIWFSVAERQAIHRGSYRSVHDLTRAIRAYIGSSAQHCSAFIQRGRSFPRRPPSNASMDSAVLPS